MSFKTCDDLIEFIKSNPDVVAVRYARMDQSSKSNTAYYVTVYGYEDGTYKGLGGASLSPEEFAKVRTLFQPRIRFDSTTSIPPIRKRTKTAKE